MKTRYAYNIDKCQFVMAAVMLLLPSLLFAHGNRRFINGHWFDGKTFVDQEVYSVEGTLRGQFQGETETVDLHGGYVIPPFAEAHTHEFTATFDAPLDRYLSQGIFYARNLNGVLELTDAVRPLVNNAESVDVAWAGAGITSSGGHPVQIFDAVAAQLKWPPARMRNQAYWIADNEKELSEIWPAILASKPAVIKAYLEHSEEYEKRRKDPAFYGKRGLSPAVLKAVVRRAHAAGLPVSVHIDTAADFRNAVLAGADDIAHLPLEPLTPADAQLAAEKGVWVVTTTLSHRPTPGISDIDSLHAGNLALLRQAGVRVALGTDSSHSVVDEIENVRRLGVFSDLQLLRMATMDSARLVFPKRKIGCLTDGCEASFLVLQGNPLTDFANIHRIDLRVKTGHVLPTPAGALPSIATHLGELLSKHSIDEVVAAYRSLRKSESGKWNFSEPQLNALGYQLLKEGKKVEAVAIFTLNVEMFPASANAYDSLGEALESTGDHDGAIANYEKVLAIAPGNVNATKMLETIRGKKAPE
ncbi:MAG: amidohydrolase family protein [Acidobacteriota bacterium]